MLCFPYFTQGSGAVFSLLYTEGSGAVFSLLYTEGSGAVFSFLYTGFWCCVFITSQRILVLCFPYFTNNFISFPFPPLIPMLLLLHDCTGFFTGMYVLHEEG